jgi:hypothetical protein
LAESNRLRATAFVSGLALFTLLFAEKANAKKEQSKQRQLDGCNQKVGLSGHSPFVYFHHHFPIIIPLMSLSLSLSLPFAVPCWAEPRLYKFMTFAEPWHTLGVSIQFIYFTA